MVSYSLLSITMGQQTVIKKLSTSRLAQSINIKKVSSYFTYVGPTGSIHRVIDFLKYTVTTRMQIRLEVNNLVTKSFDHLISELEFLAKLVQYYDAHIIQSE